MGQFRTAGLIASAALCATMLASCGREGAEQQVAETKTPEPAKTLTNAERIDGVLAGDHRTEEERARDEFRNPKETLTFFEVTPDMTVVEIWPGGGWYTNVIAPYLKTGGGQYYAAGFSPEGASERVRAALDTFDKSFVQKPETYGSVAMSVLGDGGDIAPAESADAVLTFRNVHNWIPRGSAASNFEEFYAALKPGGILGVVEHRADGNDNAPADGTTGYVFEADVIKLAEDAGFEFIARSDINANPADTKDHPFGVWTLAPVRRSSATRGQEDPEFDRAKYDAIGESDRMTLKFRKPVAADGALLE
ncbi:MAG: methyltransferase [Pseudomonadota bacterium]